MTRIQLLENNLIECTLSVESTGQECLEAVAQRLELPEVRVNQEKTICNLPFGVFLALAVCHLETVYYNRYFWNWSNLIAEWNFGKGTLLTQTSGQSITYNLDCDSMLFPVRMKLLTNMQGNIGFFVYKQKAVFAYM